jgi:ABC-type oligopeptide transport system substrate-binding subunit
MMTKQKLLISLVAALLVTATAACGVKSTPSYQDESTYRLVYPAPQKQTTGAPTAQKVMPITTGTYTRQTRSNPSGTYTPPAPATELLVK